MDDDQRFQRVDHQILETITVVRAKYDACTAGQIAKTSRLDRDIVVNRLRVLRRRGQVRWSDLAGSIVRTDTTVVLAREAELRLVLAVDEARQHVDPVIAAWASTTWDEIHGTTHQAVTPPVAQPTPPAPAPVTEQFACELCDRTFRGAAQLAGHERSKAHAARVAAA